MAEAMVAPDVTDITQVVLDDTLPLVDPSILKERRVMLVKNLDVETVSAGLKPYLDYSHLDRICAETNRGSKCGMLIDIIQRLSYSQYTVFNAFIKIIGGTQPNLFYELIGRVPSDEEANFSVERCARGLKECIQVLGHSTDSPLDQKIDLDCEHVQLTIVRDTEDTEISDDLHPSYVSKMLEREDNVSAVEILTAVEGEEKPKRVIVSGRPGTGKSTTMQWLAREWSFNRWATNFTLVFFLQLRMLSVLDCQMTAIELLTLHSVYLLTESDLILLVSSWLKNSAAKILIFVDGLDEVAGFTARSREIFDLNQKAHPIDLCLNILRGNLFSTSTVVAASRPFTGLSRISFDTRLEVIGFSESHILEFVSRRYPSKSETIMAVLNGNPLIMSICGICFYCALISSLLADGVLFEGEDLQTYTRLISFIMVQYMSRRLSDCSFLIEVSPYFHKCAHLAYQGIFGRLLAGEMTQLVFNDYDIAQANLNSHELRSLEKIGLLQTRKLGAGPHHESIAEFFHFSVQEMLASVYLLTHFPTLDCNLRQLFSGGQFDMALLYLFGLQYDTGSKWIKEVQFAVDPSGKGLKKDIRVGVFFQELCDSCKTSEGFLSKLQVCQLLHEGQMEEMAEDFAKYIVPDGVLTMSNTSITMIDLMALRFVCKYAAIISQVIVTGCNTTTALIKFMIKSLLEDHETTLETLDLSRNQLDSSAATTLAAWLHHNKKVRDMRLNRNKLRGPGMKAITEALKQNTTLKLLDVRDNRICDDGASSMAEALLTNTTLYTLYVGGNRIGDNGLTHLSKALMSNSTLGTLTIWGNKIGQNGARMLAQVLEINRHLRKLNIDSNEIGDRGTEALADALKNNKALRVFKFENNRVGETGAKVLAEALCYNKFLRSLYICRNEIGDGGAEAFARVLDVNKTLRTLAVRKNGIGDRGCAALAMSLHQNKTLQSLLISGNIFGEHGRKSLAKAKSINKTLTDLDVDISEERSQRNYCSIA